MLPDDHDIDPLVRFGRVQHVGLVVRNLDEAVGLYRDAFGIALESMHDLGTHGVRAAFLGTAGTRIELLQPTAADTGVARFLESRGPGLHHVCFEVGDIAASLDALAAAGFELIDAGPRRGAHGPVAFIHPRSGLGALIELIEAPGGPAWAALGMAPSGSLDRSATESMTSRSPGDRPASAERTAALPEQARDPGGEDHPPRR